MSILKKWTVLLMLLQLIFSGCEKKEKTEVTLLLDWFANPNHVPLFFGVKNKIFKKHGIQLKILNLQEPPSAALYLRSGGADISLYYFPSSLVVFSKNPSFKIIGKLIDESLHSFIFRKDLNITSVAGFSGKELGTYGDHLSNRCIEVFSQQGIQFSSVKHAHFDLNSLLYTKMIDITTGYWNIEGIQLEDKGIQIESLKWRDLKFPQYPELVFLCLDTFLEKQPFFSQKFREALQESIDEAKSHPDEAFECYLECHPEKRMTAIWEKKAWIATISTLPKSQDFNIDFLQEFCTWFNKNKILSGEFNIETLLEPN